MVPAAAVEGLAAYRAVLRAARRTFSGDQLMLTESAVEIRRRFEDHRGLAPGSDDAARALSEAREAAHFITNMIVQAQRSPSGSFALEEHKH
ncbi:mitochondrial zinc maintenance protein 1, mitochondrial isoform X2 [Brachypodium distachyon]|uniref:mitochondrial zinc maintenance protein 1, mitochondrial isoform X2 n=1 Tax=Brachypodium distachyon TaxID=15368 RepID=UPI000D0D094D|nr:mitochondrial zinc maintenance protein 1, mitochondrial isoform X2 [Brachypodium distachyon]|eukprot:XP_024315738.1 mitochondrial zinc maintenance protein 1, mitochondrial isoform X2 [Brachypodium distachyon]